MGGSMVTADTWGRGSASAHMGGSGGCCSRAGCDCGGGVFWASRQPPELGCQAEVDSGCDTGAERISNANRSPVPSNDPYVHTTSGLGPDRAGCFAHHGRMGSLG